MWGPNNASVVQKFKQAQAAATVLQIPIKSLEVRVAEDIERSFALAAQFGAEAVMTTEDGIQITNRARIVEFAKRQQIPVASEFGDFAQEGALMTYGPNILDSFRSAAGYVDKVVNGVAPHPGLRAFLDGMRGLGWLEADTLVVEYAYAEGRPERLVDLANALARGGVQLVVAS